jgi:sulfoxide reductase heme-binding subunit YedZ
MGFDWADTVRDIIKRPFIWLGFGAFVLLTLLAATSLNRAVRWMGSKRWQRLHQSVYAIAALSLLHFFWMRAGKNNFTEVWVYAAVIAVLLGWRVRRFFAKT